MGSPVERETNKTLCNTKDEVKTKTIAAFTNLNNERPSESLGGRG